MAARDSLSLGYSNASSKLGKLTSQTPEAL
jgi:hypothetical protein